MSEKRELMHKQDLNNMYKHYLRNSNSTFKANAEFFYMNLVLFNLNI